MVRTGIGVLASLRNGTGNNVSAERIRDMLDLEDTNSMLLNLNDFRTAEELQNWQKRHSMDIYFGIHAFRAGRLLLHVNVPYVIIFGGTDINEHVHQAEKQAVMQTACEKAIFLVCFTDVIKERAKKYFKNIDDKLRVISPSVSTPDLDLARQAVQQFCAHQPVAYGTFKEYIGIQSSDKMFILPCGIRPVKDPLFLVEVWEELFSEDLDYYLVVIGPPLDKEYFQIFKESVKEKKRVLYHRSVQQSVLFGALLESDAVLNSSISEGLSNTLLEAMYLGIPIIARNIEGNRNIIEHDLTGYLFRTPSEFYECVKIIMRSQAKGMIAAQALHYVKEHHSWNLEKNKYHQLYKIILDSHYQNSP